MKIYKITGGNEYFEVSINTIKTLANNGKVKSFKTTGEYRCFRQEEKMKYTKEMLDLINLPNMPTCNDLDLTVFTQGKINKY